MTSVLEVRGLSKRYPGFALENVSFSLTPGHITGLVGRNGAGKTTTLKALLGLLYRDAGEIYFWRQPLEGHENAMKCRVGYVSGGVDFYPRKKLRTITQVTRQFYPDWDQRTYEDCLQRFSLVEEKTPGELSQGMKVKYALTLALSHGAELLILDEPTSGLDPVSRGELLEIFLALQDRGTTILFSTHITSDLQRCAQDLLYLRQGRLVAQEPLEDFVARYRQVRLPFPPEDTVQRGKLLGLCREKDGVSALVERANWGDFPQAKEVDLEQVMLHLEREAET